MIFQSVQHYFDLFGRMRFPGPYKYKWQHRHNGGKHDFHIVVCAIIHGNEVGSLPAILQIIKELHEGKQQYGGSLTFVLGNPEAALKDVRFIESDLNRVFLPTLEVDHETRRVKEIIPILDDCDLLLDLHQTILPSHNPFYIFPRSQKSIDWATAIQATSAYVDATPPRNSSTRCADDYVWGQNKPSITLELGKKGFTKIAKDCSLQAIKRLLQVADDIHLHKNTLQEIKAPPLNMFKTIHREPFNNPQYKLKTGLINFSPVKKGEVLSAPGTPVITSPYTGKLLFPKYPPPNKSLPKDIFRIIT